MFRTEVNPVHLLRRAAYIYPANAAIAHVERRHSYRQFADRSWRFANALRGAGLRKSDRVALLANPPAVLEAHFGVPAAGGILVTINTRLAPPEIEYILDHSGALLADEEFDSVDLSGSHVVRCPDSGEPGDAYGAFLAGASAAEPEGWLEHRGTRRSPSISARQPPSLRRPVTLECASDTLWAGSTTRHARRAPCGLCSGHGPPPRSPSVPRHTPMRQGHGRSVAVVRAFGREAAE